MPSSPEGASPTLIPIDRTYLPTGPLRQISRVTDLDSDRIVGEMDLSPSHWVYAGHFPGDPIFPGCLVVEAAGQIVALWAWAGGQRGRPRYVRATARFQGEVRPSHQRLVLTAKVQRKRNLNFGTVTVAEGDRPIAAVEVVLAVLDEKGVPQP
jgi:3-hydroxymyristoyl/3-hydroxydecanoyl-(acyl carrier protein) dehydratase